MQSCRQLQHVLCLDLAALVCAACVSACRPHQVLIWSLCRCSFLISFLRSPLKFLFEGQCDVHVIHLAVQVICQACAASVFTASDSECTACVCAHQRAHKCALSCMLTSAAIQPQPHLVPDCIEGVDALLHLQASVVCVSCRPSQLNTDTTSGQGTLCALRLATMLPQWCLWERRLRPAVLALLDSAVEPQ